MIEPARFVDVSQFQPEPIDWPTYKAWSAQWDGISRVAMRSSYGVGYVDDNFRAHRANALNVGINVIIYYHYSYPQFNNASDEANWQKQVVGGIRAADVLRLDVEENVVQSTAEWAYEWLAQQTINYGKASGIYASSAYIQERLQDPRLAQFKLWLANWQFTPDERPACPPPWSSYEFVQYTDKATIPGITGTVDADIYLGKIQPEEQPMSIDLSNGAVAAFFTGNATQWTCRKNGFTLHGEILAFYQTCGGSGLCGLTDLGLPLSPELPVAGHPGVVNQEFERGGVRFDPDHLLDGPPSAGRVYKIHTDQDPRFVALQSEIAQLQTLPSVANLLTINSLAAQIVKASQVQ